MRIPIYRAKHQHSNEYVEGHLSTTMNDKYIIKKIDKGFDVLIDPSTLAIHFPDWICTDEETGKEVKVFASLQENKKHGDIIELRDNFQGISGTLYFDELLMFNGMPITKQMLPAFVKIGIFKGDK